MLFFAWASRVARGSRPFAERISCGHESPCSPPIASYFQNRSYILAATGLSGAVGSY